MSETLLALATGWGLAGLFLWSFLAATLLPLSSEAALAGAHSQAMEPPLVLLLVATAGNVCGAAVNWLIGRWCLRFEHKRWFPVTSLQLHTASDRFRRWGAAALLFSWIPVIGDPLTVAAGALRYPLARFLIAVTAGKALRYAGVLWITDVVLPVFAGS